MEKGNIVIEEFQDCPDCNKESHIIAINTKTEKTLYKCTECEKEFWLNYSEVQNTRGETDYFCLNGAGDITFKSDYSAHIKFHVANES